MVKCEECNLEMTNHEVNSCTVGKFWFEGKLWDRKAKYGDEKDTMCHDCCIIIKEGNFHHDGCDMEPCPKCNGQLISCGCF